MTASTRTTTLCALLVAGLLGCSDAEDRAPEESAPESEVETISRVEAGAVMGEALGAVEDAHRRSPLSIPTAGDAQESNDVLEYLRGQVELPGPAYRRPGGDVTQITVYEVLDLEHQDEIVELLRAERTRRSWKPVMVVFKEAELLRTREIEGGGTSTVRGAEKVLREVMIR